jgi:site-specific DNA recombinase
MAGKIWCTCGKRRTGEGPQHGKHLYYRCSDRVNSYPLPPSCREKGVNARIADVLIWDKLAELMSSPELLKKQAERWFKSREANTRSAIEDTAILEKEVIKLKEQEDRYAKAYGAGLFDVEKLKEYTLPLREKIASLESQIHKAKEVRNEICAAVRPSKNEIEAFCQEATKKLYSLNFEPKKAIVMNIVEKVVGTRDELKVYGYIPITNHVESLPIHRHRRLTERRQVNPLQRFDQEKRLGGQLSLCYH